MIICHIYFRKLDLNKRLQTQRFYLKYFLCSQCDFYLINYKHTHTHKKTQNLYFIVLYSIIIFISAMIFMQMHTYIYILNTLTFHIIAKIYILLFVSKWVFSRFFLWYICMMIACISSFKQIFNPDRYHLNAGINVILWFIYFIFCFIFIFGNLLMRRCKPLLKINRRCLKILIIRRKNSVIY